MPHISKHRLTQETKQELEDRVFAFLFDTQMRDRKKIFRELFTRTERTMIAKRLTLIFLISQELPPYSISRVLKMSPSSVARFQKALNKGEYAATSLWLKPKGIRGQFLSFFDDVADVLFSGKRKSIAQILKDNEARGTF
ncbi:MAG: hypothetical protein Greene07147_858 [Parcubacteria group bacterium Greene0714_7]|nr:MAG: hypothetical protein Greene07147_858 [Parcubacteria group bacterium Greene0714_7]